MSIREDISQIPQTKKHYRDFGLVIGIFFFILAGLIWWHSHKINALFLVLGSGFLIFALMLPNALKPLYRPWMIFAVCLGWVMSRILLTVLFYLGVTPIALIARLSGKKFLDLNTNESKSSYWVLRDHEQPDKDRYEKQY